MSASHDTEFETFVLSTWPRLRQAAYALTRDTRDAEDLLQTVLTKAYTRWSRVRRDDPVAYVRRSLVNAYIDTWRRARTLREVPMAVPTERPSSDDVARVDQRDELVQRLDLLSERERTIVVMRHYLDLTEAEVARTLGCSVGTVKSTCSRALQRLRIPSLTPGEERS
jgi:RNA polymerase sigma-70 factor (sigma-E family)